MANFMSHFVDYRKNGAGVRKNPKKVYSVSEFWRIYRNKFFKLMGLNLMYVACLLLVGAICYLPMSKVIDNDNYMATKLESYELNSQYVSMITAYVQSYKIDDKAVDEALPYVRNALERINKVNPDLIKDGTKGFDLSVYSAEDEEFIFDNLKKGFAALGFTLVNGEGDRTYILKDSVDRQLAKAKLSVAGFELSDTLPRSVYDIAKIILCLAPIILLAPINLAFFRIVRDYVRESPSFMFSDIWDTIKVNWWQSLVIGLLEYVSFACVGVSLMWYYSYYNSGFFFQIGFVLCLVLAYVIISMSFYVGIMQVSLDMNLRKIIKNAFYFSVICLWKNLFMILVTVLMIALVGVLVIVGMAYPEIVMSMTMVLILIMLFSFWFYFIAFMTYPSLLKYIIDPYYAKLNESKDECESDNSDKADDVDETQEEPEYVYHNGRMVHRSVLEQENLFND